MQLPPLSIFWFRRDLRLDDNAGLYHALKSGHPVLPLFIFDRHILDDLTNKRDARVEFIHQTVGDLKQQLEEMGSTLLVYDGKPEEIWQQLLNQYPVAAVFTNRDYEPYAIERDTFVANLLSERNIPFHTFKDHVIFEKDEVLKEDGTPYTVFTPYSKRWRMKLDTHWKNITGENGSTERVSFYLASYPTDQYFSNFLQISNSKLHPASAPSGTQLLSPQARSNFELRTPNSPSSTQLLSPQARSNFELRTNFPSLADLGFEPTDIEIPPASVTRGLIRNYDKTRDFPALAGTSRLGIHFRFGTISIREKARSAQHLNATYLNELIWRDFYSQILGHFPHVVGHPFRPQYDRVEWRDAPEDFQKWCAGKTGYPIVDAGMRELNASGYMHNRVRMITASFLSKHLLLDWRLGEAYFAQKLLDYDLASNSGGWQWAAGCGTDAAPYFRIFNPSEQVKKFDPKFEYVRRWVPEFGTLLYPAPMVEHTFARERCLAAYKKALGST